MSFLEFSKTIKEDLSNYDETSACKWLQKLTICDTYTNLCAGPVLLDEYVEWKQGGRKDEDS